VLVVVSGFVLSVPFFKTATVPTWLLAMQGLGLLGAIVAIWDRDAHSGAIGPFGAGSAGRVAESFAGLRRRQVIFATVAGVFALLALIRAHSSGKSHSVTIDPLPGSLWECVAWFSSTSAER